MKAYLKYWNDTKNVDLVLTPETDNEVVMLGLLKDRTPHWYGGQNSPKQEIIFEPKK